MNQQQWGLPIKTLIPDSVGRDRQANHHSFSLWLTFVILEILGSLILDNALE
jgi:hypothetical protein